MRNWKRHVLTRCALRNCVRLERDDENAVECDASNDDGNYVAEASSANVVRENRDARSEVALFLGRLEFIHNVPATVSTFIADNVHHLVASAITEATDGTGNREALTSSRTLQALGEFRSNYALNRYLSDELCLVEPETVSLGRDHKGKVRSYQYIPILTQLKGILISSPHIRHFVLPGNPEPAGGVSAVKDITGGSLHLGTDTLLRLAFYYDDFGVTDPLGNKVAKYKISGIYFTILNIPAHLRSRLSGIFLAAVCRSVDVNTFGWCAILARLIADIKELRDVGIVVNYGGRRSLHVKGVVSCLVGDNLAQNGIGGFTENFSGGRCCRTCTSSLLEQQSRFSESECHLRDVVSFEAQLTELKQQGFPKLLVAEYGVKEHSPLCEIDPGFPIERLPPDVAHDLLEGVIHYTLPLVLQSLIQARYLTLDIINSRIESFNFQEKNKPQPLKRSKGKAQLKIRETAKESWTLLRTLSLLIGDLVPEGDKRWGVHIGLCQVIENVFAGQFCEGDIVYLEQNISQWLGELKETFPSFRLKPKFHFLVHYGTHIRRHGPLRHLWTMRFESKHSTLKTFALRSRSRIDVCKTMAKKHQRALAMHLHDPEFMAPYSTEKLLTSTRDRHYLVQTDMASMGCDARVGHAITVNGVTYKKDDVVLMRGNDVEFGCIRAVLVTPSESVYLAVTLMEPDYDAHLNAYRVRPTEHNRVVAVSDLLDYHPLKVYSVHGHSFVVLLWYVTTDI